MNKQANVLIISLLVVLVATILLASFFLKAMNSSSQVKRFVNLTQAFWLAEAGLARAVDNMPNSSDHPWTLSTGSYIWTTSQVGATTFFQVDSTGSVSLPSGSNIRRKIQAYVETSNVDPNNFQHAIRVTGNLVEHGAAHEIIGDIEEGASLNFTDLFEHTTDELEAAANYHYIDPATDVTPVEQLTWVEIQETTGEFQIASTGWRGGLGTDGLDTDDPEDPFGYNNDNGAILIVEGDTQITGGTFYGIIYVIGKLKLSGNAIVYGSILAESGVDIDTTVAGNVHIEYSEDYISNALDNLQFINPTIVSWEEVTP